MEYFFIFLHQYKFFLLEDTLKYVLFFELFKFSGSHVFALKNYTNQIITILPSRVFDTRIWEIYEWFLLTYFFN